MAKDKQLTPVHRVHPGDLYVIVGQTTDTGEVLNQRTLFKTTPMPSMPANVKHGFGNHAFSEECIAKSGPMPSSIILKDGRPSKAKYGDADRLGVDCSIERQELLYT